MTLNILYAFSAFSLLFLSGCSTSNKEIKKTEWLIGTWECKTPEGSLYETWNKLNQSELAGKSYFLNNQDTVLFETIQLIEKSNKLLYIVTGKTKVNESPVSFESIVSTTDQFIFENKHHDFPQRISYQKVGSDSLLAEISGYNKGKEGKEMFPMKKIK